MQHADLMKLKERVREVVQRSVVDPNLGDISLEAEADDGSSGLLRVLVEVKSLDDVSDADLDRLQASIENALSAMDDRFPSIRFDEAA
jgi:hypothetical protein